ncbi:MAG: MaoC family dehydratase N-terminal domain-containing protein [Dehalococcoidia bacterium]
MSEADKFELISQEMLDAIGKKSSGTKLEVDKLQIRLFARAVGHTDPIYYDEAEAKKAGFRSLPCPPGYLGTPIFDPSKAAAAAAGPAGRGGPQPKKPLNRVLNGGTVIEYFDDICAGDTLTSQSYLADVVESPSASLGLLLISTNKTEYTNQDGKVVAVTTGTSIRY